MAVLRKNRHTVAVPNAETAHRVRPGVDAPAELPISEPMLSTDNRFSVRPDSQSSFEKIVFIQRDDHGFSPASGFVKLLWRDARQCSTVEQAGSSRSLRIDD
jgi:hypothetical protein